MVTTINPYLTFDGNCGEAFDFYKSVFGGKFSYKGTFADMPDTEVPASEKHKIMHISLPISKETVLMGSDTMKGFGPKLKAGNNFSISINAGTEKEARKLFEALTVGGKVGMALEEQFWGALFGMVTDKFGIQWMVNYDLKEKKA